LCGEVPNVRERERTLSVAIGLDEWRPEREGERSATKRGHVKTSHRLSRIVLACVAVVAVCGLVATAAWARPVPQTAPGEPLDPRTYAPDTRLFLILHAIGVQKYTCQANGTWLFTDPEATLYKTTGSCSRSALTT
jgi:hypothetical protein